MTWDDLRAGDALMAPSHWRDVGPDERVILLTAIHPTTGEATWLHSDGAVMNGDLPESDMKHSGWMVIRDGRRIL